MTTPNGLITALKYGKDGHRRLLQSVSERLRMSERRMHDRYEQINQNEERFQAFIPESENDRLRKRKRDSSGIPSYSTIEIPYSYATLLTAHTYYSSVFLSRAPVFQMAGRHGEAEMNIQAVEAIFDYQRQVGEWMVPLYIWLMDPGKAGFGVIGHHWDETFVNCRHVMEKPREFMGLALPGLKPVQTEEVTRSLKYQGNRIYNVRPQDFFPDPRVAMRFFQRGEFCGRYVEIPWTNIIAGEESKKFFNVEQLRKMRQSRDNHDSSAAVISRDPGSQVQQLPNDAASDWGLKIPPGFIKAFEIYVRVIPADWNFGTETAEEMWAVTVSANGVIFGCEPMGEYHGDFPFDIIEQEVEGYSMFTRSMLEVCQPLADIITWLVNSHFYNVRQTLNNQFIVDPSMVVMKDLEDPEAGKLIRLKPESYGRDVRTVLTQLQTMDVTQRHIGDVQFMAEFLQRVTGVTDQTMGMLPAKSHTTATAVRTSSSFGVNRMKTTCEYFSAMGWSPLTQKLMQRTQQFLTVEQQYRIAGDLNQFGKPFVQVDAQAIAGFYDYVPVDGTMPVDRFAQANLWQQILGQAMKMPQVLMNYDIAKIFAWVATLAGLKNISQFKITPDAMLQQQMQAGNVVPIGSAMKDNPGNLNEPQQLPGMGATG